MPAYFIRTYGCQMNESDSEIIAGILESKGFVPSPDALNADIIITNTCSVRDSAEGKAKGFISTLAELKRKNPALIIAVIGCMAERLKESLLRTYPFVDIVLGPNKENEIETAIEKIYSGQNSFVLTGDDTAFRNSLLSKRVPGVNAWVTIMEGCNNFCSYCIVPYVRGREKSRPPQEVLDEIHSLDKSIFKEVMLLGQNVNSYEHGFSKLLASAADIPGVLRLRFMTSHPKDMTDDIIDAVRDIPNVCESFHIPLQSGDDGILKLMNRGYDADYYSRLVGRIRDKIPEASVSADAIAGFPGETQTQFENTLRLIEKLELDAVNTLAFNPRPGTKAASLPDQVDQSEKSRRLQELMLVVEAAAMKRSRRFLGTTQEILVEKPGSGRTRSGKIVKFPKGAVKAGDFVLVRINEAKSWVLDAEVVS